MPVNLMMQLAQAGQRSAQAAGPQAMIAQMMPLILIFVIMYLLLIRPQQKKAKQHTEMVNRLKAGDEVITNGGICGTIAAVEDKAVVVEIADNVKVKFARTAIAKIVGKDSEE